MNPDDIYTDPADLPSDGSTAIGYLATGIHGTLTSNESRKVIELRQQLAVYQTVAAVLSFMLMVISDVLTFTVSVTWWMPAFASFFLTLALAYQATTSWLTYRSVR